MSLAVAVAVWLLCSSPAISGQHPDCQRSGARTPAEHLKVAECLAQSENWKAAEEHFRFARQSPATLAAATVGHARVLYHLNQPYDAMRELDELLKKHPDSAPALELLATLHTLVADDTTLALELMERCSRLATRDSGVWQHLGNLYLVKRRDEEALRCFERAVELTPRDPQALACLGYFYSKAERAEEAKARFDQALALVREASEPAIVWLTYGRALQEQRQWEISRSACTEALKLDPKSSEAYYARAVANENLKEYEAASADALAAISEFPVPRKDAYLLLLRIARAQKDPAKAAQYARELAEIDAQEAKQREDSRVLRDMLFKAEPLFMQGQYVQAAAAYEELVNRVPTFYEAYFALGMCYAHTSQPAKAEEAFRKYLVLTPLSSDGHASLGLVLLQAGRTAEARPELERALELDPGMLEARASLARIHASASDFLKAIDLLVKAPNPEAEWDEDYYILLVSCTAAAKRPDEAAKFCAKASARYPSSERLAAVCRQNP